MDVAMNIGPRGVNWWQSRAFLGGFHLRNQPVSRASAGVQVPPFAFRRASNGAGFRNLDYRPLWSKLPQARTGSYASNLRNSLSPACGTHCS
jgi:hypothetical protein